MSGLTSRLQISWKFEVSKYLFDAINGFLSVFPFWVILLKYVVKSWINNTLTLLQITGLRWTGNKSFSEPAIAKFTGTRLRHRPLQVKKVPYRIISHPVANNPITFAPVVVCVVYVFLCSYDMPNGLPVNYSLNHTPTTPLSFHIYILFNR